MNLKELLETKSWKSIAPKLLENYPEAEKDSAGYEKVFEYLKLIKSEEMGISIIIRKQGDVDGAYFDVSGLYNNPKKKDETYPHGLELTPWNKWLGMYISEESLKNFSESEIVVHCLYEMTFIGFSEDDIPKAIKSMENRKKSRQ